MISPFLKIDVTMKLSYRDLIILQKAISSTLPESMAESAVVYIHGEVQKHIERIEKS